jgi:hypothetical protein
MTLPNEEILVLGTYGSTLSANKAVDAPFPPSSDWEPGAPVIWDNDAVRQYQCATMVNLNQPGSGASSAHMRYVAAYDTNSLSSGMLGIDRSADAIYSEFVLIDPNDPEPPEIVSVSGANVGGNLCVVVLTGDGGLWFTYENPVTTWHTESWLDLRTIPGGSRRFVAVDTAKVIGGPNSGLAVVALDSDGILTHMLIPPPVVIFDPPQLPVPWSDFEVVVRDFTWSPAVGCARLEYTRTDAQGNVTAAVDGLYVVVSSAGSVRPVSQAIGDRPCSRLHRCPGRWPRLPPTASDGSSPWREPTGRRTPGLRTWSFRWTETRPPPSGATRGPTTRAAVRSALRRCGRSACGSSGVVEPSAIHVSSRPGTLARCRSSWP